MQTATPPPLWRFDATQWMFLASAGLLAAGVSIDAIRHMADAWFGMEEYSHGVLIPFITAYLIWQKRIDLAGIPITGSWLGLAVTVLGILGYLTGELASLYIICEYSFLVIVFGLALATTGTRFFSQIWVPLFLLFFAIRLPQFLYQGLSAKLQLWSSSLGVHVIRLFDISVYLEGNVIDLGSMQLQVVEACSGLRYLFPLTSLAFMCAYFYRVEMWKRVVIFLSSVPVTILMNSFRIGVIGVTVEYFGKQAAEGFLHDFEGWAVFMFCTAILLAEMWLLARLGPKPQPLSEAFAIVVPESLPSTTQFSKRRLPVQFWAACGVLLVAIGAGQIISQPDETVPPRTRFSEFPMQVGDWTGQRQAMEQKYIDTLKFDDYIMADYHSAEFGYPVNFYAAYYSTQRKGESIHSPSSCIPGGGWEIKQHAVVTATSPDQSGQPIQLNRLLIQKGEDRQLVYYWFQQRGRVMTNEYLIKWYLFWDALTMNRSDGALVRLITPSPRGEDLAVADQRMTGFLQRVVGQLPKYIPD